ncbi:hypothetical protein, partial [Mesorhizobium sp. M1A.F.Ca.IN.022.05.2.1]|uniref:hypothetical protein n=4 Tax=Mesorhizobium TaxID=68287 RepID=UPI0013DF487C
PRFVPPSVPPEIRVEALSFGTYYVAVFRRDGQPDETLDGPDGKPLRFGSASEAIRAGKAKLVPEAKALAAASKTFKADRRREIDDERERVFANFRGADG